MSTSLFSQNFRHNGSAVFGTMPPMCRSCPDVNKLRGMETTILGQHRPFVSIKSFVQHSGWQEMVSLCSLIRLIGVCADRDQPEFLCSRSDSRHLEVHVATAGGWLTRYRPREVRNSIYRYRKIDIDYRSKFSYRFISPISIIYGNTINLDTKLYNIFEHEAWQPNKLRCKLNSRPRNRAFGAHYWNKSTPNEHIKQEWCETIAKVLRKWLKTWLNWQANQMRNQWKMTKDWNFDQFIDQKWPKNWASEFFTHL